jgi:hypothetical protein
MNISDEDRKTYQKWVQRNGSQRVFMELLQRMARLQIEIVSLMKNAYSDDKDDHFDLSERMGEVEIAMEMMQTLMDVDGWADYMARRKADKQSDFRRHEESFNE